MRAWRNSRMSFVSSMLLLLPHVGCSIYMGAAQPVELLVTDARSGQGVGDAMIDFATEDRTDGLWLKRLSEDEYLDWYPHRRHITNVAGRACVVVDIAWVTGGLFADLNTERDRLTGKRYLFRITKNSTTEILVLEMTPRVTTRGGHFAVTVISVGRARSLTQDEFVRHEWHGASWAGLRERSDTPEQNPK